MAVSPYPRDCFVVTSCYWLIVVTRRSLPERAASAPCAGKGTQETLSAQHNNAMTVMRLQEILIFCVSIAMLMELPCIEQAVCDRWECVSPDELSLHKRLQGYGAYASTR